MARQKATRGATQMARDMAGNGSSLASVKRAIAPATRGLRTATRHNKKYGPGTILALIALAASSGASAGGCLELREYAEVVGSVPTGEWARRVIQTRDADVALRALRASAARQLRALRRRGDIPKEIVVAPGMTAILRYGRMVPGWLVRARPGHGSTRRERHMTAQCAANGMWITMDAVRVMPGDPVEAAFSTVYGRVLAVCARAGVRPVLLMDREFFTTGVLERLGRRKTRWLMPCPNYPRVAAALREHAARSRARVSSMRIPGGRGREAPYTMIIRRRKRREGDGPEGRYIAFASNSPSPDPDAPCPRRWGIEINYKMPRQTRMRTPGRDEHVRIFCFVVSLLVHNAWTMLHSDRRAGGDDRRIPKMTLGSLTLLEFCMEYGIQPWLRPPRKPPP